MRRIILFIVLGLVIMLGGGSSGQCSGIVHEDLSEDFSGFTGTFVLYDRNNDLYTVYSQEQAGKRLTPCSTFKIYNSLIGLESGVLDKEDVFTLIKWDGTEYPFSAWNKDQTLSSAMANSVVWYYQELAARIGSERMQLYLDKLDYGNKDISGGITQFWLRSSLKITAWEQADLLRKLYNYQLPFEKEDIDIVKKITILSDNNGVKFSGNTGSGYEDGKWVIGWFVGCVERDENQYIFVANIEADDGAHGGKAREIAKQILKAKAIL